MQSTFRDTGLRSRVFKAFVWSVAVVVAVLSSWAFLAGESQAGQERYDYDPIGRLLRYTDSNNQLTEYTYDAAGNILAVTRSSAAGQAPVLSSISPSVIRRGETKTLTLTGERLQTGALQTADPELDLSNPRPSANQLLIDVAAGQSTGLGNHTLTFSNSLGSAHIALAVGPKLPTLSVEPSPLALPPDNTARAITLRLSNVDVIAHTINVASSDTSKATVSPASVVIAAGQTSAMVNVTPKVPGFVTLTMSSPTLQTATVPVFVTSDFRGVNTSFASPVGVVVGQAQEPTGPSTSSATFVTPRVGVAVGPILTGVSPTGVAVGTSHNLVVTGSSIPGTVQLSIVPAQGITATWAVEPAGDRIAVALSVDGSAATGPRRLVVTHGTGSLIPFADPARSQFTLTTGQPSIASISPLFAKRGIVTKVLVRGANLQNGRLLVNPPIDLQVDSAPVVNADGTELTTSIHISRLAATGPRVVQVVTPSGESTSQANSANQLAIVSEIQNDITPIFSPLVGIVVGTSTVAEGTTTLGPVQAPYVGLVVGPAAYSVTPTTGILGTTMNLVVNGVGLNAVQAATMVPAEGLGVGPLSVNAEGTQLTIPVAIAANAARGGRRVTLATAAGKLLFSPAGADQFQLFAPAPELVSISPLVVAAGKTVTLTVRGRNFSDVTSVQFDPPAGMTPLAPFVATEGNTVLTFAVQVSAAAPTGPRTLIVHTAGGPSTAVPSLANTIQVGQKLATYDSVMAPSVGLVVGSSAPAQVTDTLSAYAPMVGLVVGSTPAQDTRTESIYANNVGVVVGVAATGITPHSPDGYIKGASSSLVISGFSLDQVTSVIATGTSGISFGTPVANETATRLTVPVTVSPTAPSTRYGVELSTGLGTTTARVTATDPAGMFVSVGSLPTSLDSVSPIVLEQGKTYTFTVRGANLKDVYEFVAEPASGLNFGVGLVAPQWSTDSFGEKVTIPLLIDRNAAIGSRVVRLRVPGGMTSPDATPANTITIVAPQ